jgi:RNA polymerase sigma-19 factor, ECF subfamily
MYDNKDNIVERFKAGDAEAFDKIYQDYSKKVLHFVLGLVKDKNVAQELVQEVFVNLWEKRGQVNPGLNFDNYIFTITHNSIRKHFRKKAIEKKALHFLLNESPEIINDVEGTMIYNELLELASKTIENLPPQRKKVYKLSKQEGLKIKEIASKLNISPRTAENHLARALKYLKEELSEISFLALLYFNLFLR